MHRVALTSDMFRAFRTDKAAYTQALLTIYPAGVHLISPNGKMLCVVRPTGITPGEKGAEDLTHVARKRFWLCELITGKPMRLATVDEHAMWLKAKSLDPHGIGAIQLTEIDGNGRSVARGYYCKELEDKPEEPEADHGSEPEPEDETITALLNEGVSLSP